MSRILPRSTDITDFTDRTDKDAQTGAEVKMPTNNTGDLASKPVFRGVRKVRNVRNVR